MIACNKCTKRMIAAGQAFTQYTCSICGEKRMHANTAVPAVCSTCSDSLSICGRCGIKICRNCKEPSESEFCSKKCGTDYFVENI